MIKGLRRILLFQTAFPGDVVLTIPLAEALRRASPRAHIAALTIPAAAELLANHPAISEIIRYDKRGSQRGLSGASALAQLLREKHFDAALIPHRSLRSAAICARAGIPMRVGFTTSAGRLLLTHRVPYEGTSHEVQRNLSLALPLGVRHEGACLPSLYPSMADVEAVDALLKGWRGVRGASGEWVALAPGSIWNTKRWPQERFADVARRLTTVGIAVVLVGGRADEELCRQIALSAPSDRVLNAAGRLSLLQSAELIRRCTMLISNDSAPAHLAMAVRVPVIVIFGATVPRFGFAPLGRADRVIETNGLVCRPCGIHGGTTCPVGTFDCMLSIDADRVTSEVLALRHNLRKG